MTDVSTVLIIQICSYPGGLNIEFNLVLNGTHVADFFVEYLTP